MSGWGILSISKRLGGAGSFLLALCLTAGYNFSLILHETIKASGASGTHTTPDGFTVTVCYFGPPIGFYPRFFVLLALLVACAGVLGRGVGGKAVSSLGVAGALSAYVYWWAASYKVFMAYSGMEIDFLNHPEISQVAYLYEGSWLDVCVAGSLLVACTLLAERALRHRSPLA
jgi:hypothetical protein